MRTNYLRNPIFRDAFNKASSIEEKYSILQQHGVNGDLSKLLPKIEKVFLSINPSSFISRATDDDDVDDDDDEGGGFALPDSAFDSMDIRSSFRPIDEPSGTPRG